jgi:thiamine biosynthesis protein ThiI
MESVVLCRFGELFLKAGNRKAFERVLADNVRAALADLPRARVEQAHGRLFVRLASDTADAAEDAEEAAGRLSRVFGLVSFSVARQVDAKPDLEAITAMAVDEARAAVTRDRPASFKVEARRPDKRFPKSSMEIDRHVGAAVQAATGLAVDVHQPALRLGIEVGTDVAYVFAGKREAPGGLPVGASGRALLLLSGGIDSPVAGWLAAKRGLALDAVYFHSPPYIGEKSRDKVLALGKELARWQALRSVTVVPFTDVQKRLRDTGPAELAVVLYRRMMMRIADAIADNLEAGALVTGENLGQVASQTIENMTAIEAAARRVVLRPLLTYDKVETTALARRIGTYETSILPFEDCCSLFVPTHPATRARAQDAERVEAQLDVAAEIASAVAGSERIAV